VVEKKERLSLSRLRVVARSGDRPIDLSIDLSRIIRCIASRRHELGPCETAVIFLQRSLIVVGILKKCFHVLVAQIGCIHRQSCYQPNEHTPLTNLQEKSAMQTTGTGSSRASWMKRAPLKQQILAKKYIIHLPDTLHSPPHTS
jgi:hypothetical protein